MTELVVRPMYETSVTVEEPGRTYVISPVYLIPDSDQIKLIADGKAQEIEEWVMGIKGFTTAGKAVPMEEGKEALKNIYVRRSVSNAFNDILSGKEKAQEKNLEPSQDGATVSTNNKP